MKFERITNEYYGARNAGYSFVKPYSPVFDAKQIDKIRKRSGEAYVNNMFDSFADCDGDLFRGDDGLMYVVSFDWGASPAVPAIWHRVEKAE
jgi:hypothetical protein